MSDVHVLIPGIMGSVLAKDGKDAFGLTASAGFRALFSGGDSVRDLAVDPTAPPGTRPDDGVRAVRVAADAHLVPGLWKIDGYGAVSEYLVQRMKLVAGQTFFEFPYDWRLDNRVAAQDLQADITQWLAARRQTHPQARVVLIAHSMGGLVARYYLEVLGGWRDARALVTFGTPYRGSLNALNNLGNGMGKLFGLVDLSALVRSFPSVHQLLPIYRCIDTGDTDDSVTPGEVVMSRLAEVADRIPTLNPAAVVAARAFHTEIEEAVAANRLLTEYHEAAYKTHCVVGNEQPTAQSARWDGVRLTMLNTHGGTDFGGDGTVPRVASSPLELDDDSGAMFSGTKHSALQNAQPVLTQLRGWLSGADLSAFRGRRETALSLDLADVHAAGDAITGWVTPSGPAGELRYRLEPLGDDGAAPVTGTIPAADGPRPLEIAAPGIGGYRITIDAAPGLDGVGPLSVEPVSDLIVVAPR